MNTRSRILGILMFGALMAQPLGVMPALAQGAAASAAMSSLSGTVFDPAAAPIAGATVTISGPASATATTGADGKFTVNAPAGVYRIVVRAPGYTESTDDNVVLTDTGTSLNVQLSRPTFSSLQTIGSVRTTSSANAPAFNASAVAQTVIGAQTIQNQSATDVRDILNETPGIIDAISNGSANGGSPGAITFATIRGGLSYETSTEVDGHPLAALRYGDYVTTFLNPFMFQTIEVTKGPGAMPSNIARSINGTLNFRTWDPTQTPTGQAEFGVDSWGGKYADVRFSDSILHGKIGFVIAASSVGTPGAGGNSDPRTFAADLSDVSYTNSMGVPVIPATASTSVLPGASPQSGATLLTTNAIACCINMPDSYSNRSELAKLRFNFSEVTSFTATMLAGQSYSSQNGNTENLYPTVYAPQPPSAYIQSGMTQTFYPYNDAFAYDYELNNEPMFQGEFHTQLKNDNILARFYSASITRLLTNNDQSNSSFTIPVQLYGVTSTGQPLTGNDAYGNPYLATITDPLYQNAEQDNLLGYTFEYDKALGDTGNLLTFSADENYAWVHYYIPGESDTSSTSNIPAGSAQDTSTYKVGGQFAVGSKLNLDAAYYLTRIDSHYNLFTGSAPYTINWNDDIGWHSDERFAAEYRLDHDTSLRFSAGSSLVAPFIGLLNSNQSSPELCTSSTCPSGVLPGAAYYQTQGGFNLVPETSFGYDLGFDLRPRQIPSTVISGDIYLTNLHNQFLSSTYFDGNYNGTGGVLPLYVKAYGNLSDARYEGLELKINHQVDNGWGYLVQGSLMRGYPYNVPPSIYQFNAAGMPTSNTSVVSGANFGPNTLVSGGGSAIPYAQGYAELNYSYGKGWYGSIGMLYFGNNNSYNEPAFEIVKTSLRMPIVNRDTYIQWTVNNLFNINPEIFDVYGQGVPGQAIDGYFYASTLKGYGPRNFHLEVVHHFK